MEDSRLLAHAIDYLTQMADGKDPLTGFYEAEESCLYQSRVSRCLQYTIEVMQKVLNGELVPVSEQPKAPVRGNRLFTLTGEQLAKVEPLNRAVSLTKFLDYLKQYADDSCKRLPYRQTAEWLVSQGMLAESEAGLAITEAGQEAGIRIKSDFNREVIVYSTKAQRWIIERLPDLIGWVARSAGGTVDPETGELLSRSRGKAPFSLTEDQLDEIPILPGGTSISQFVQSINSRVDTEKVEKLRRTTLTNWLLRQGYLQTVERDGRNYLSPTPKGEQSGIKLEQRTIGGRTFWSVVYHDEGQMLLLEHLRELCGLDG